MRSPARARSALAVLPALVALVPLAPAGAVLPPPGAPAAQPAPLAVGRQALQGPVDLTGEPLQSGTLTVTDLRPRAPRPDDPLQVLGTVTNTAERPIRDVAVQLRLGDRLASRSEIAARDAEEDPGDSPRGEPQPVAEALAPGATAQLDLRTLVSELRMERTQIGVYPLTVRITAVDDEGTSFTLDEARTYLPWFSGDVVSTLRLAFVVPLQDQPRLGPDEQLVDGVLPSLLDGRGRLGGLLRAASQGPACRAPEPGLAEGAERSAVPQERLTCTRTPVTFAADPDLLYTASALTQPVWTERANDGRTIEHATSPEAASFLARLRALNDGSDDVLALPFADPDLVALTRGGSALGGELPTARALGRAVTTALVGPPLDSVALAPPGPVSTKALDAVRAGSEDVRAVVLDPSALTEDLSQRVRTPDARVELAASPTGLTGLVVDEGLSTLLVRDPSEDGDTDARLLQQRWLVETAMIAAEAPSTGRTLVVQLPRQDPVDPARLRAALTDAGRLPWTCGVTLDAVARGVEACPGQPSAEPAPDRGSELVAVPPDDLGDSLTPLPEGVLARVARLRDEADQFTQQVLDADDEVAAAIREQYQRAVLRSLSTAWRTEPNAGQRLTGRLQDELAGVRGKVVLTAKSVLLTSKDSRLDVSVTNQLTQPVTVKVRLSPPNDRLVVDPPRLVSIPPRTTRTVTVDATTLSSGRFLVAAELLDRADRPFGPTQTLQVRSTRYGTLALAVTGVAAGVLLVAAGVRVTRRALSAGRRGATA